MDFSKIYDDEPSRDIICVDCKSFYASCEAVSRGLDPLKAEIVVLSGDRNFGGLILASSPTAKRKHGITNVTRSEALPLEGSKEAEELIVVPPRMFYYMEVNRQILNICMNYAAEEDIHVFSIDELFIDLTRSYKLFGDSPAEVAQMIQKNILEETGIFTTIGLGDTLTGAKFALDCYSKTSPNFFSEIRYRDVPEKVWPLPVDAMCGIADRLKERLQFLGGIRTLGDLAHSDPYFIKSRLGIVGVELYLRSFLIDRARISDKTEYKPNPNTKSIGNSQVLAPNKYFSKKTIDVVLSEIAAQVGQRLRKANYIGSTLHLGIRYGKEGGGFSHQIKIPATNQSKELTNAVIDLFDIYWNGSEVRNISISVSNLSPAGSLQLNLFEDPEKTIRDDRLDDVIAQIRRKYSFKAIINAHSLLDGGTAISRASSSGGHAGGLDGLEG